MRLFKENIITRKIFSLIFVLIFSIGLLGSTTAFANERTINPRTTVVSHGSTGDYVTGSKVLSTFTATRTTYTVSYFYESLDAQNGQMIFVNNSTGQHMAGYTLINNPSNAGTLSIALQRGITYRVMIVPANNSRSYMCSYNIYY